VTVKRVLSRALALTCLLITIPAWAQQPPASKPRLHLKTVSCIDSQGIGTEAFSVLAPTDWNVECRVQWRLNNPFMPAVLAFVARGPDNLTQLELLPAQTFFWTDNGALRRVFPPGSTYLGCEMREPVEAAAALTEVVIPRFRSAVGHVRVVGQQSLPALTIGLPALVELGPEQSISASAARCRIEYAVAGKPVIEDLYCLVESDTSGVPSLDGLITNTLWSTQYLFALRLPKDAPTAALLPLQSILYTFRVNPDWFSRNRQLVRLLVVNQVQQVQSMAELSRYLARTSEEIDAETMSAYSRRQLIYDRIALDLSPALPGVEQYLDPDTGQVIELPAGYAHAWTNGAGEYLLADSPGASAAVPATPPWRALVKQ